MQKRPYYRKYDEKRNAAGRFENRIQRNNVNQTFKPLVEVDPSIVKREALKNPLPGNYLLNKTASTEGIASKKSLELKKRYLLGETAANSSILKSDSASALDTKFKSFASNISECQKLLNPATEISPSMQTFLQRIDRNNELNKSQHSMSLSKSLKDKYNNNNHEEKENRSIDFNQSLEITVETVNTVLIENKIREIPPEVPKLPEIIETIDLVTPEKKLPIVDLESIELPQNTINDNKQFIENMEKSPSSIITANMKIKNKLDTMFIDLTLESPPKEQNSFQQLSKSPFDSVPDLISNISTIEKTDDENIIERPRSPAHETTIQVPQLLWSKAKEIETDSLSESSTSSLEDIPHFILDSTTSPETQNENKHVHSQPPRLEIQDATGEFMQIDSLMIIDGQYIGDPEDLPLFKKEKQHELTESSLLLIKPLKFDTKNENKLESLKNLPLIVSQDYLPNDEKISSLLNPVVDDDKTPIATVAPKFQSSGSEKDDFTAENGGLTETELSDWSVDDAVSENFMDTGFAVNSGKETMKRNKKLMYKSRNDTIVKDKIPKKENENDCGILKNLAIEEIDFMDTGSEAECNDTMSTTNRTMLKNKGYVEFVDNSSLNNEYKQPTKFLLIAKPTIVEAINTEVIESIDYIEQGAYIFDKIDLKTPINEEQLLDSLDIDEDSLVAIDDKNAESLPTLTTTTETTEELTIVTSPLESIPQKKIAESTINSSRAPSSTFLSSSSLPLEHEKYYFERESNERISTGPVSSKQIDETGSYEDYVKSLQIKIAQISNGKESLEKRSRRKFSKNNEFNSELLNEQKEDDANVSYPKIDSSQILTKKLEELTKERTKQKDIIHDLVMNKLQAKKQLNAEKRLNRSKNRNLYINSSTSSGVNTFNLTDGNQNVTKNNLSNESNEQLDSNQSNAKLTKSQSFAFYTNPIQPKTEDESNFKTPIPPPRSRLYSDLNVSADRMREDARARARLKSNEDLGLSPEEKILLLRKRYNLNHGNENQNSIFAYGKNQSDDMKTREKKLATSKSFNDISRLNRQSKEFLLSNFPKPISECMSDPNLPDNGPLENESQKSCKSVRRDSERRKSIIQTVSDFFHKKRESTGSNKNIAIASSSKDKLSESSSTLSVFSRFRLSPKSKDKSKVKDSSI